jgi:radical SAM protein with 4Fe4S-binding SPASM domain
VPGSQYGFGKTPAQNLMLVRDLAKIAALGFPVLLGTSRKSTLGLVLGEADPLRRGPVVEVQMVAFAENLDELLPMLAICHGRLGVDLNVMGMFTYGGQEAFTERALEDVPATRAALQRAREDAARRGMWRARASRGAAIAALSGEASRKPCLVPWYSAIVSTDGDLYPCCHHTIRGTCVGNVLRDGFSAVWNGPAMRDFRGGLRADRCGDRVCATCPEHDAGLAGVRRLVLLGRGGGAAPSP